MNYPETSYAWQHAYMAAVCETDNGLMMIRIYEALAAIEQRRKSRSWFHPLLTSSGILVCALKDCI